MAKYQYMDNTLSLTRLISQSLKKFYINCLAILKEFITAMSDPLQPTTSTSEDPRLSAKGSIVELSPESIIEQAQLHRKKMMTDKSTVKSSTPTVSNELLTKVDSILMAVNTLQSGQREIYNLMKAMTPRFSKIKSDGPTNHLETVGLTNNSVDAKYLEHLRGRSKQRKLHE